MYDDFGVCSDFDSELSWISYPPRQGFLKEYYENNPRKQAENELFKQKIKITFQYANIYTESYTPDPVAKLELKPCRKTQTFGQDLNEKTVVDFDPFASEESLQEQSSDALSCIDSDVCKGIMVKMYAGCSEDETEVEKEPTKIESAEDDGESYVFDSDESEEMGTKRKTKKRKRTKMAEEPAAPGVPGIFDRKGFNGRGTSHNADLTGHLGNVYDTKGHMIYDKDYISAKSETLDDILSTAKDKVEELNETKKEKARGKTPPSRE